MEECSVCGAWGSRVQLFDAVFDDGLKKICEKCSQVEHMPVLNKPTSFQLEKADKRTGSFHERATEQLEKRQIEKARKEQKAKQDVTLKDIIEKNLERSFLKQKEQKPRLDLVENFHWIIMRARRKKHLSIKELAEEIKEPEITVRMIEKGVLPPKDEHRLVNKLESYLGIQIILPGVLDGNEKQVPEKLDFEKDLVEEFTISDLQEIRKKKES